ncbi:MAG: hypothetical protein ABEJ86_07915 [Halococcoides sp.]
MTLRGITLVARTELRRSWRTLTHSARGAVLIGGGLLFGLFYAVVAGGGGFFLASEIASPDAADFARTAFAAGPAGVTGVVAFVVLQRSVKKTGEPDGLNGLLTATDHPTVALGVVLAEFGRVVASIGVIVVAGAIGIAVGVASTRATLLAGVVAGTTAAVIVTVSIVAMLVATVTWAYAVGLGVRYVLARSAFVSRHRSILGIATTVVVLGGWIAITNTSAGQAVMTDLVTSTPFGWWADLVGVAVAGLPATPIHALLAAITVVGLGVTGPMVVVAISDRLWYVDPVQTEASATASRWTDRLLPGVLPTASAAVARKSWLRARRAPFTVQFAIFPYFFLIYQIQPAFASDPVPPTLAISAGLATAVAAGAAFSLNPIGGEGPVMPVVLLAAPSGWAFVTGLALAGALPGTVFALALVTVLGVALQTAPVVHVTGGALAVAGAAGLPAIATGIGTAVPKFETNEISGSEVVVPSGWAFGGYLLASAIALGPGVVGVYGSGLLADYTGVAAPLFAIGGLVCSLGVIVTFAIGSLWIGARRFEGYHLD